MLDYYPPQLSLKHHSPPKGFVNHPSHQEEAEGARVWSVPQKDWAVTWEVGTHSTSCLDDADDGVHTTMCGHFTLFTGFVNGGSRVEVADTCRGPTSPISHYYYRHYFYTIKVKWLSTCDMWPKSILHPTLPSIQEWTFFQNRCVFDNSTRICIEHTFFELSNQKTTPPLFWNK